jgi:hypothetical protein
VALKAVGRPEFSTVRELQRAISVRTAATVAGRASQGEGVKDMGGGSGFLGGGSGII